MTKRYKLLAPGTLKGPCQRERYPAPVDGQPGAWVEAVGPLVPCHNGVHLLRAEQVVPYLTEWQASLWTELWEVQPGGDVVEGKQFSVWRRGRLLRPVVSWDAAGCRRVAVGLADAVLPTWEDAIKGDPRPREAIKAARAYAGDPTPRNLRRMLTASRAAEQAAVAPNGRTGWYGRRSVVRWSALAASWCARSVYGRFRAPGQPQPLRLSPTALVQRVLAATWEAGLPLATAGKIGAAVIEGEAPNGAGHANARRR